VLLILVGISTLNAKADVVNFTLIDASSDQPIAAFDPLIDGAQINLNQLGASAVTIKANVSSEPGSVTFNLTGTQTHQQTESVAPFALFGDQDGDFDPWDTGGLPNPGQYQLTAQTHSESNGGGNPGPELSISFSVVLGGAEPPGSDGDASVEITGPLQRWHRVTVQQDALAASETSSPNPFLDFRFDIIFSAPDGREFRVPGYFAGDGNGGGAGTKWRAHIAPDMVGEWNYLISFRGGDKVAVSLDENAGSPITPYDGVTGSFTVSESTAMLPDFRAPQLGLIKNRGGSYLTFAGGDVFLKGGPDIPENILGYEGFDNTPNAGHSFTTHIDDWNPGDPDWNNGAGRGLIGALNFISGLGANSIYFLPMNIGGDGNDTFPTIAEFNKTRYDLSKLAQWEVVFEHAQSKGIWLHFVLAETEPGNENYHDNGQLGPERKLFYRMLLALFGHHNGIQFNIGEENDYGTEKREQFAAYLKAQDMYDHPVTTHTNNGQYDQFYGPLLGNDDFDITSFQGGNSRSGMFDLIMAWKEDSRQTGTPWVISFDEPQKIENNLSQGVGYPHGRRDKMWPVYMAGGGGFEWYVQEDGGGHSLDQRIDDFGIMREALTWTGHAIEFFRLLPLTEMKANRDQANSSLGGNTYILSVPGNVYALYNDRNGGPIELDLTEASPGVTFQVSWFNPRNGEMLVGDVATVTGGAVVDLGSAPNQIDEDWAVLVFGDDDFVFADGFEILASTAPVIDPQPANQNSREGDLVQLQLTASDPDNSSPLIWEASGLPPDLMIDPSSGLISGQLSIGGAAGVFVEQNNLLVVEMESAGTRPGNWLIEEQGFGGATGSGYLRYDGTNQFNNPGIDVIEYPIRINNPGTYRFQWRSIVGQGTNTTEHNDTWLKIKSNAFFAEKGGNILCPKGFNSEANDCNGGQPNGSGSDGWFKVYRSGGPADSWSWSTNTSDNDAHQIFARFDNPGTYSVLISGRSAEHVIDRMVLYRAPVSTSQATETARAESPRVGGGASVDSPYRVQVSVSDEATRSTAEFTWFVEQQ